MAASIAKPTAPSGIRWQYNEGPVRVRVLDVTLDSSYATGGYAISASQVFLHSRIEQVEVLGLARTGAGGATAAVAGWDYTNGKLQVYVSNGASPALLNEAPATTNLSTNVVRVAFKGY